METRRTEDERRGVAVGQEPDGRSFGALLLELTKETTALVRGEVALARTEIEEKVAQAERGIISMASGGAVLFAGILTLIACAVLALSLAWPAWVSALVVGLVVTAIGVVLVLTGRKKMSKERLSLHRTMSSLRDTKTFAQEQTS